MTRRDSKCREKRKRIWVSLHIRTSLTNKKERENAGVVSLCLVVAVKGDYKYLRQQIKREDTVGDPKDSNKRE